MGELTAETDDGYAVETGAISLDERVYKVL